jgi:heptosyltransferase-1
MRILVVRLGAMGDVIHALPAVATLRRSFPQAHLAWAIEPRWQPLITGAVDEVLPLNRRDFASVRAAVGQMRKQGFDLAIDMQGLIKSAVVARFSGATRIAGYAYPLLRERLAGLLYTERHNTTATHIVDRHVALANACGALQTCREFRLPLGKPEGALPENGFVLSSPFAGWSSKEWPLEHYAELANLLRDRLGCALVLNGHAKVEPLLRQVPGTIPHISSIEGLIDATRRARAVIGLDSGPLHLAAALRKPGVAIFGPTDPARNGPYGGSLRVLRDPAAITSYKRRDTIDPSMRAITPRMVIDALEETL